MTTGRDPYSRVYDAEDDFEYDFEYDLAHEVLVGRDEFGFEECGCTIPERCCMPGWRSPPECASVKMMEDLCTEASAELVASDEQGAPI